LFLEDLRALVHERKDEPIDDLGVVDAAGRDADFAPMRRDELVDDLGGLGLARAVGIVIPPRAGLLPEAPHLAELVGQLREAIARPLGIAALAHAPPDVVAGKIADAERTHRKTEGFHRGIDLLRRGAFL